MSDASQPRDRARVVGVYRFWRDFGFVLGALIAGIGADVTSAQTAIAIVAVLTGASGLFVAATSWQPRGALQPAPSPSHEHDLATKEAVMAVDVEIDVDLLKNEIKKTYAPVSQEPERDFIFPTGRAWAEDLRYARAGERARHRRRVVRRRRQPLGARPARAGRAVLDLGSGAGTDSLVAAQMVGEQGSVTGIDMTPEMLTKARTAAAEMNAPNVEFVESEAERLPFPDESFDVVISNGVIDLIPDKDAVFAELFRVLVPGGRMQIADVTIQNPVSAEGRRNIDLWTG